MILLDRCQVDDALPRIEAGLAQYLSLQADLHRLDVSADRDFQRRFNRFYRVRRGTDWQWRFYALLERGKRDPTDFTEVLRALHAATGRYEASFASKLVATLYPDRPVIDRFVLANAGLRLPGPSAKDRPGEILACYVGLQHAFAVFLRSPTGTYLVESFLRRFPGRSVTAVKMLDLVLWQTR